MFRISLEKMFFKLAVLLAVATATYGTQFTMINNSGSQPVFVQILGTEVVDPFVLQPKEQRVINFANTWNGRVWGRSDCLSVDECNRAGIIPTSLAELNVDNGFTFYDLSLVDGFNIMNSIEPVGGTGDGGEYSCRKSECAYPILDDCPSELRTYNNNNVYATCSSAYTIFNTDLYCCRGEHDTLETCHSSDWPVDYASFFKQRCPNAYSYAYDDQHSTYTCNTIDYIFTFL